MIPTIVKTEAITQPSRIGAVVPVTPITATPDSLQSAPDFTLGQKYSAMIGSRLANGTARVSIAGQLIQMNLPNDLPSGKKIELVFIAREPQLKFLLQRNALPGGYDKNLAAISTTGRFLGFLSQETAKSAPSPSLFNAVPVLTHSPLNSVGMPALLQKALSQSGLFYESHQSQWLSGKKTLAQLKQEPQGQLKSEFVSGYAAGGLSNEVDVPVHAQSLPLVMQQLSALETNQLVWRGEIWPEQMMDWNVSENESDENKESSDELPPKWQTQLRLTLPKLGEVVATIVFDSTKVRIQLKVGAETFDLLEENKRLLATAMFSAGLNAPVVEVLKDEE